MAKPVTSVGATVVLTNQSVHLLRQVIAAIGWAKTIDHIYIGGRLLSERLPEPDLSWVKTPEQLAELNVSQRASYVKRDKEWANATVSVDLTQKEKDAIKAAFDHVSAEGKLAPHPALSDLISAMGWVSE